MCVYTQIFGTGAVLEMQLLAVLSVILGICLWVYLFRRQGILIRPYLVPLILWIIFGTLDIVVTAKGVFSDPSNEGFWLARAVFEVFGGMVGPAVASVLWISLWAGIVLLLNRFKLPFYYVASLAVFYALAIDHFLGFSTWMTQTCGIATFARGIISDFEVFGIIAGILVAAIHALIARKQTI